MNERIDKSSRGELSDSPPDCLSLVPVICDRCRATGLAGEDPFAELADLLSFTPVPRRPHANGWTPELQRGFIGLPRK